MDHLFQEYQAAARNTNLLLGFEGLGVIPQTPFDELDLDLVKAACRAQMPAGRPPKRKASTAHRPMKKPKTQALAKPKTPKTRAKNPKAGKALPADQLNLTHFGIPRPLVADSENSNEPVSLLERLKRRKELLSQPPPQRLPVAQTGPWSACFLNWRATHPGVSTAPAFFRAHPKVKASKEVKKWINMFPQALDSAVAAQLDADHRKVATAAVPQGPPKKRGHTYTRKGRRRPRH